MADENNDGQEKTEDATEERRDQFREKGEIAHSREVTSVLILCSALAFLSLYMGTGTREMQQFLKSQLSNAAQLSLTPRNVISYCQLIWMTYLRLIIPIFVVTATVAIFMTFSQTRFNMSMERIQPKWNKLNPWEGLKRMVSTQALMELLKSLGKMGAVGGVTYLILHSEWTSLPGLINMGLAPTWMYWLKITRLLFWSVAILLLLIAAADYFYQFMSLEKKMRMSKQELKEEYKQREADPLIKGRMRRMQRDFANRKTVEATKTATVIITNPTHYAVALRYEIGMRAPMVVAKGADFVALHMRELATSLAIPIVENKPLARTLFKVAEVDQDIPESLYKAVSEVIRYVFKLKGIKVGPS